MSEARRSCRSRKTVDYSAFGGEDNDDDFADPTPPAKKVKGSNKENKLKRKKEDELPKVKSQDRRCGNRQSLDDKLFDRDLEAALKLSVETSVEAEVTGAFVKTDCADKPAVSAITPIEPGLSTVTEGNHCQPSTAELDDEIIDLSDGFTENPRKRRKAAAKPVKYADDDDDNQSVEEEWNPGKESLKSGNDEDDDDEFDPDDSDSEYGASKKKKGNIKIKTKVVAKKATPAKPKSKANVIVTPVRQNRPSSVKRDNPNSRVRSAPLTPSQHTPNRVLSGGLKKTWVPPARSGSSGSPLASLTVKSPSSGLRLGLSRNQKVKSLHPSIVS